MKGDVCHVIDITLLSYVATNTSSTHANEAGGHCDDDGHRDGNDERELKYNSDDTTLPLTCASRSKRKGMRNCLTGEYIAKRT